MLDYGEGSVGNKQKLNIDTIALFVYYIHMYVSLVFYNTQHTTCILYIYIHIHCMYIGLLHTDTYTPSYVHG